MQIIKDANMGYFFHKYMYYVEYKNGIPLGIKRFDFEQNQTFDVKLIKDNNDYIYETCNPNVFMFNGEKHMIVTNLRHKKDYSLSLFKEIDKDKFMFIKDILPYGNSSFYIGNKLIFGKLFRTMGIEKVYFADIDKNFNIKNIKKFKFYYKDKELDTVFSFSPYKNNLYFGSSFMFKNTYVTYLFEKINETTFKAKYKLIDNKIYKVKYSELLKKVVLPYKVTNYICNLIIKDEQSFENTITKI